jgi:hypothetical protein
VKHTLRAAESINSNANKDRITENIVNALSTLGEDLKMSNRTITEILNQVVVPQNNQWYKLALYKVQAIPRFSYNRIIKLHLASTLRSNRAVPLPDPLSRKEFFKLLFALTIAFFSSCGAILVFYHVPGRIAFSQNTTPNATDDNPIINTSCIDNCMVDHSGSSATDRLYPKQIASFFAIALVFLITTFSSLSLVLPFVLYFPWSLLYVSWFVVDLFKEIPGPVDEVELNEDN